MTEADILTELTDNVVSDPSFDPLAYFHYIRLHNLKPSPASLLLKLESVVLELLDGQERNSLCVMAKHLDHTALRKFTEAEVWVKTTGGGNTYYKGEWTGILTEKNGMLLASASNRDDEVIVGNANEMRKVFKGRSLTPMGTVKPTKPPSAINELREALISKLDTYGYKSWRSDSKKPSLHVSHSSNYLDLEVLQVGSEVQISCNRTWSENKYTTIFPLSKDPEKNSQLIFPILEFISNYKLSDGSPSYRSTRSYEHLKAFLEADPAYKLWKKEVITNASV